MCTYTLNFLNVLLTEIFFKIPLLYFSSFSQSATRYDNVVCGAYNAVIFKKIGGSAVKDKIYISKLD
jgi:hypothetical protein